MFTNPLTERLAAFVRDVGIEVRTDDLPGPTFLPGLDIRDGALIIDEDRLSYPGDILHEAGHIAVADLPRRHAPILKPTKGEEMAAMAWSYAASCALGLAPEVVFHPDGYKGGAQNLIDSFTNGQGSAPGVPLLQYFGQTFERRLAAEHGVEPYPHMLNWLRPETVEAAA